MRNLLFLLVSSFCLLGCLEFDILVKVNSDGSGTVEQTVLINKAMVQQIQDLTQSFGAPNKKKFSLIDKRKLIKDAATMGEGVYFLSAKPVSEKDREGYIAYYSFKDINSLKIHQNPSDKVSLPGQGESKQPEEPFTFSFQKGKPSTLTLRQPEKTFAPDSISDNPEEPVLATEDTSGSEMMMDMMQGFRMSVAIQINGTILKTNASHVDANRVTLLEMDLEQLVHDRKKFSTLSQCKPQTMEEAKQVLKDIPGVKFEMENVITIQFH